MYLPVSKSIVLLAFLWCSSFLERYKWKHFSTHYTHYQGVRGSSEKWSGLQANHCGYVLLLNQRLTCTGWMSCPV